MDELKSGTFQAGTLAPKEPRVSMLIFFLFMLTVFLKKKLASYLFGGPDCSLVKEGAECPFPVSSYLRDDISCPSLSKFAAFLLLFPLCF